MKNIFKNIRILFAACLLTACTPARTGVIGNSLTTNVKPLITITGLTLSVQGYGKLWADARTDSLTTREGVSFDYAIFADSGSGSGPVPRFAYAAIARITRPETWMFQPTADPAGAFAASVLRLDGIDFMVNLIRTGSEGDWPSELWRENGRDVPETWLVKRWTAPLADGVRAVMEYREPWPACLTSVSAQTVIVGGAEGECLHGFVARADAAFRVEKKGGTFPRKNPPSASGLAVPRTPPNIEALMGHVIGTGNQS